MLRGKLISKGPGVLSKSIGRVPFPLTYISLLLSQHMGEKEINSGPTSAIYHA